MELVRTYVADENRTEGPTKKIHFPKEKKRPRTEGPTPPFPVELIDRDIKRSSSDEGTHILQGKHM